MLARLSRGSDSFWRDRRVLSRQTTHLLAGSRERGALAHGRVANAKTLSAGLGVVICFGRPGQNPVMEPAHLRVFQFPRRHSRSRLPQPKLVRVRACGGGGVSVGPNLGDGRAIRSRADGRTSIRNSDSRLSAGVFEDDAWARRLPAYAFAFRPPANTSTLPAVLPKSRDDS